MERELEAIIRWMGTFESAARHGSFRATARELCVTPGAVSRQIKQLEDCLGRKLFERSDDGVTLSHAGEGLLPFVLQALGQLREGVHKLRDSAPVLRISALPILVTQFLMPRLPRLEQALGRTQVEIRAENQVVDLRSNSCDVALRGLSGPAGVEGVFAKRLLSARFVPACRPDLLSDGDPIESPADLAHYPLLEVSRFDGWRRWFAAAGQSGVEAHMIYLDDFIPVFEAARAGRGVLLCEENLIESDLRRGTLVKPIDQPLRLDGGAYLLCRWDQLARPEVARFCDWVLTESALQVGAGRPATRLQAV